MSLCSLYPLHVAQGEPTDAASNESVPCPRQIVVIGRTNYRKSSVWIDTLLAELRQAGHEVHWFESRQTENGRLLDRILEQHLPSGLCRRLASNHGPFAWLRKLLKALLLLRFPSRWIVFVDSLRGHHTEHAAAQLERLLGARPAASVVLFGHSAGGIVSLLCEPHQAVDRIICIGYPFRHPERGEEKFRTDPLAKVGKPVLIIQGNRDEYGNGEAAHHYRLAPSIQMASVGSNHDYRNLSLDDQVACRALVERFLGSTR